MIRPIAISLSPNTEKDDIILSLKYLFSFWNFSKGKNIKLLEQWFKNYFKTSSAVSFNSARSALYAILKSLEIGKGDEVIIQPFTCVALPNAITALKAKPVYADIEDDLSFDIFDLEKKISKKTKAIILQYTFGIPHKNIEETIKIADKNKISVIEDSAHVIGEVQNNKKLGTFGKASFFSFGRDKAFSSVFGGMVITKDEDLAKKIKDFQKTRNFPLIFWTAQQLFHPVAFSLILPLYNFFSLGKLILIIFQKLHFLSIPVSPQEKEGNFFLDSVKKMPNSLAGLAYNQLKKINKYNKKRKNISQIYISKIQSSKAQFPYIHKYSFLRFPVLIDKRDQILSKFKKKGIYLGKWYSEIIDPKDSNIKKANYEKGSCPKAEKIADKILNLPCYPTMKIKDAEKIVKILNNVKD